MHRAGQAPNAGYANGPLSLGGFKESYVLGSTAYDAQYWASSRVSALWTHDLSLRILFSWSDTLRKQYIDL